jgi:hypothetical protein
MSLDWDITNCKNMEALQEESNGEWAITNALIWTTMHTDMGSITAKNAVQFYARTKVVELFTPLVSKYNEVTDESEKYAISFEDITKRIGLSTNVYTEPITKWFKKIERYNAKEKNPVTVEQIKATYYGALVTVAQLEKGDNNG